MIDSYADDYAHGAAHAMGQRTSILWLRKLGRSLRYSDVLSPDSAAAVRNLSETQAKQVYRGMHCGFDVRDVGEWKLQAKGLGIIIPLFGCGDYATSGSVLVIPWSELRPYFAANLPFRIEELSKATDFAPRQ